MSILELTKHARLSRVGRLIVHARIRVDLQVLLDAVLEVVEAERETLHNVIFGNFKDGILGQMNEVLVFHVREAHRPEQFLLALFGKSSSLGALQADLVRFLDFLLPVGVPFTHVVQGVVFVFSFLLFLSLLIVFLFLFLFFFLVARLFFFFGQQVPREKLGVFLRQRRAGLAMLQVRLKELEQLLLIFDVERVGLAQGDHVLLRQVEHILLMIFKDVIEVLLDDHLTGARKVLVFEL